MVVQTMRTGSDRNDPRCPWMLEDARPILWLSRIFGCNPGPLGRGTAERPKLAQTLYSVLAFAAYTGVLIENRSASTDREETNGTWLSRSLRKLREDGNTLCAMVSCLMALVRHHRMHRALAGVREFDAVSGVRGTTRVAPIVQWIALALLAGSVAPTCLLARLYAPDTTWFGSVAQPCVRVAVVVELVKFYFALDSMRYRFRRLNEISAAGVTTTRGEGLTFAKEPTATDVRDYYLRLERAMGQLKSFYGTPLACWIGYFVIDIVSFFFLSFSSMRAETSTGLQYALVLVMSLQVWFLVHICHWTSATANALAGTLFSFKSPIISNSASSMEIVELSVYLYKNPMRIVIGDIFTMDYQFLVTIISIVVTYVLILIDV